MLPPNGNRRNYFTEAAIQLQAESTVFEVFMAVVMMMVVVVVVMAMVTTAMTVMMMMILVLYALFCRC